MISGHISLQFHVLLFYKPLQRVIDCQKELAEILDSTKKQELDLSNNKLHIEHHIIQEQNYWMLRPLLTAVMTMIILCASFYLQ